MRSEYQTGTVNGGLGCLTEHTCRNRRTEQESHKHPQERPITDRSGQQYPGEIAAGGPATPEGLPGAKPRREEQDAHGSA